MRVLTIAAHPDDEVLGAGATMARLRAEGAELHVAIVTEGSSTQYPDRPDLIEAKKVAARRALDALGGGSLHFGDLPDMKLDTLPLVTVNAFLERVVRDVQPTIVFTHHGSDLNRDHRVVHEASKVACRASPSSPIRSLLAYDILAVTGSMGAFRPSVFYPCAEHLGRKAEALRAYDVELRAYPHARSIEAIEAHARIAGVMSGAHAAEAFEPIRVVV